MRQNLVSDILGVSGNGHFTIEKRKSCTRHFFLKGPFSHEQIVDRSMEELPCLLPVQEPVPFHSAFTAFGHQPIKSLLAPA
jgi:hypothetical protein